jgi:hypothetical protein
VSAVWNLAYDAGMGLGAAGFGVLAVRTGYPAAFALAAAVPPAVLTVASAPPASPKFKIIIPNGPRFSIRVTYCAPTGSPR